jgi:hypothetical protein
MPPYPAPTVPMPSRCSLELGCEQIAHREAAIGPPLLGHLDHLRLGGKVIEISTTVAVVVSSPSGVLSTSMVR